MALTRSKFTITIDIQSVMDRSPNKEAARREVVTAIREWCDRAEQHGIHHGLHGNIVSGNRILGQAHETRPRTAPQRAEE